jgi:hypothetical protein
VTTNPVLDGRERTPVDNGQLVHAISAKAAGSVKEMTWRRSSFGGVSQLFVDLDEPSPVVRAQVQDLVCGAYVGYCMTKAIGAPE